MSETSALGNVLAAVADALRDSGLGWYVEASGIPVDVVLAGPGLEDEFLSAAHELILAGVAVPVISAEDLIVTKILAGRPKDKDDVDGILREQLPVLDLDRCRRFLSMLEEALSRGDLLSEFEDAIVRARPRDT